MGGLSYTVIGVIVATAVGLLGIILARTYFRKQGLPAGGDTEDEGGVLAGDSPKARKAAQSKAAEKKANVEIDDDELPPLEGDEEAEEGSGDNATESGSDVDAGFEAEEAPVIST